MKKSEDDLTLAYKDSVTFANSHYENFPVVSFLVPKHLRKHVAVIYKFARQADDIADEGRLQPENRIELLDEYESKFLDALNGKVLSPFWMALLNTIRTLNLTPDYFLHLLKAFRQDVTKKRYKTFQELLDYCKYSANPVGRLILELFNIRNDKINVLSDSVCTALQLTNFYQDVSLDFEKGRIYISEDEMKKFNISENDFEKKENSPDFNALVKLQVKRTEQIFREGYPLLKYLPVRMKFEIHWTILGGKKILEKIEENDYNVLNLRPVLSKKDYIGLLVKSIMKI